MRGYCQKHHELGRVCYALPFPRGTVPGIHDNIVRDNAKCIASVGVHVICCHYSYDIFEVHISQTEVLEKYRCK